MFTSLHPKIAAIAAALAAIAGCVKAMTDGDPATNPNWAETGALISIAYGLLRARQNNVSSEQAGAKPAA